MPHNTNEISIAYRSKYKHELKNQVILLMITNGKNGHYLAVRSLSPLLRGITSSNSGDFYCLNCFHSYHTNNKLKKHERVCNNQNYRHVDMAEEDKNILKHTPGEKSLKVPFIIYADLKYLLKKEQSCQNSPKNSNTERKARHKRSGYSWRLVCLFDKTKKAINFIEEKIVLKSFVKT